MSELKNEACTACRADAPKVTDQERAELSPQIADWNEVQVDGVPRLVREFSFKDFVSALAFGNRVGELAESLNHHPKIVIEWGRVEVSWWTHKIKGLHRNDFIAAAKTDALGVQIS